MKLLKILPAAASVIALTASVAFANDDREREEEGACRTVITISQTQAQTAQPESHPPFDNMLTTDAYQVKIARGERVKLVLIDAYTGKIIEKRDIV